jgi:hypothetical protein
MFNFDGCAGFSHSLTSPESKYNDKKILRQLYQLHVNFASLPDLDYISSYYKVKLRNRLSVILDLEPDLIRIGSGSALEWHLDSDPCLG